MMKPTAENDTPLMTQYRAIKARHPDAILFFRMGDFFEMFGEDAQVGSRVLGITLTSRGHGKVGEVPLAGFPHHALDGYLAKMIRAGHRVAICEQMEDPRFAKGIVKRDVIHVVTPGTAMEENLLDSGRNNFLASVVMRDGLCGIAWADVSTGDFYVAECVIDRLAGILDTIAPSEILCPEDQTESLQPHLSAAGIAPLVTKREPWRFDPATARQELIRHFKTQSLRGFGVEEMDPGIAAAGAVLEYLRETQKTDLSHIRRIVPHSDDEAMTLDSATRRNLELTGTMVSGERRGSLLAVIDRTRTAMGSRTLSAWVSRPLKKLAPIRERLDAVETLVLDGPLRKSLAESLKGLGDIERLATRVVTRRAGPRDLAGLKKTLDRIGPIRADLEQADESLAGILNRLDPCDEAAQKISAALADDPPIVLSDGGVIRDGYDARLDELRKLAASGKDWIACAQADERERTGISSLKIGYNSVFGYYIEVTKTHLSRVPADYIRKQTLVNAERFITPELKEREEEILNAEERSSVLEKELFEALRDFTAGFAPQIQENGKALGELDALLSLAETAHERRYVKPDVHEGDEIIIKDGRHPVVESFLPAGEAFIPNDVELDPESAQILMITGPNMAGKSTYIRQVGLIVLLAQIGSFVPASEARIGLVDRIFTRVGSQDNLARGESTFLVEMNETASILNNATPKSLILLDEIGRGTSTFDGLSIAWAVAEFLHESPKVRAKTLFATHYHELTDLARLFPRIQNFNVAVKEWGEHIVFLRKIVPGGCDHSYGISVARLAGLPPEIISRAREVLRNLEETELAPNAVPRPAGGQFYPIAAEPQLSLFTREERRVRDELAKLDLNAMTPLDAMRKLDELKKIAGSGG